MPSMPTDRRTKSGVTPVEICCASSSCWCVVVAGWMARDLASPMFARWLEELKVIDEFAPCIAATFQTEADEGAGRAASKYFDGGVVRAVWEAGEVGSS